MLCIMQKDELSPLSIKKNLYYYIKKKASQQYCYLKDKRLYMKTIKLG
jgi:hypothetical protein